MCEYVNAELTEVKEGDQSACNDCLFLEELGWEERFRRQPLAVFPEREYNQGQAAYDEHSNHTAILPFSVCTGRQLVSHQHALLGAS